MKQKNVPSQKHPKKEVLYNKYPAIFRKMHLSAMESSMFWGIECGDGWLQILDALCEVLTNHALNVDEPSIEATQVKQKFGSLRFRIDFEAANQRHWVRGAIQMACAISCHVCEETGRPGILMADKKRCVRTLAEDYGREHGFQPAEAGDQEEGKQAISADVTRLSPGWRTILNVLKEIVANEVPSASVMERQVENSLLVDVKNGSDWVAGAVGCAVALTARTDSETGLMKTSFE